jgi:nucleotide-binding universal stress UspA family protein
MSTAIGWTGSSTESPTPPQAPGSAAAHEAVWPGSRPPTDPPVQRDPAVRPAATTYPEVDTYDQTSDQDRHIVVGIDGSPGSRTALAWAMTQARLTGATVEAIVAWQESVLPLGSGYVVSETGYLDGLSVADVAQKVADDTVAAVAAELGGPAEDVRTRTVMGHPAQVLAEAAVGAQLLVVGSRGHGTFAGMLLGSVSQHCVQHAPCPVVVVPQ